MRDIREYKKELRTKYRAYRTGLTSEEKERLDRAILERVLRLRQYISASLLLVYVSTPIEVDTRMLIQQALADGKRVAVPRCVPNSRQMEFYEISSLDDLSPGTFGVDEPAADPRRLLPPDPGGLCIVPALCYDEYGYRLGYGKGYYDRYLANYSGIRLGICYRACVRHSLFHGRFDRPVELLITERYIRRTLTPSAKAKIRSRGEQYHHEG